MSNLPDKEIYQQLLAKIAEARPVLVVHLTLAEEPAGLADVLPKLDALGITTAWTLTPDGITITCPVDAGERLQQLIAATGDTQRPPLCEYCHTRHYGYQDHHLA